MHKLYIFSLGNPDQGGKVKYKYTRHNAARLLCDAFDFEKYNKENNLENKNGAAASEASSENKKGSVTFEYVVPDCFMNESGKFILDYIKYKNISIEQIVVVYDDIDINFGEIKLSHSRNSGGHNGVESIIQALSTKAFHRVRVGIGAKTIKEMLLQDYVLSKLSEEEINILTFKNENKVGENSVDLEKIFKNKLDELLK